MRSSGQKVIDEIRKGAFGRGNVTRWGREYRIRPEGWEEYKRRRAEELEHEISGE